MKILVTGAEGFVGRNLCAELVNREYEVLKYDLSTGEEALNTYCKEADFVFHLAGVNRPVDEQEFFEGNADFSAHLCDLLKEDGRTVPIAMTSSIQAALDNAYGKSKVQGGHDFLVAFYLGFILAYSSGQFLKYPYDLLMFFELEFPQFIVHIDYCRRLDKERLSTGTLVVNYTSKPGFMLQFYRHHVTSLALSHYGILKESLVIR